MLWLIAMILVLLWTLGVITSFTIYGLIHILPAVAVVLLLIEITSSSVHNPIWFDKQIRK